MSLPSFVEGIFIEELKNRFLCLVKINGIETLCYIPSSCRLENFIPLKGKKVLLHRNNGGNARTQYSVFAIRHKKNHIILKPAIANEVIGNSLQSRRFSFVGNRRIINNEILVDGYKTDFYIPDSKTIIEIKSIISISNEAVFPTVYSERAINQLKKIKKMLNEDYNVFYFLVSLNPYVKSVSISSDDSQKSFKNIFNECISKGMVCRAYTAELCNNQPKIKGEIPIKFN